MKTDFNNSTFLVLWTICMLISGASAAPSTNTAAAVYEFALAIPAAVRFVAEDLGEAGLTSEIIRRLVLSVALPANSTANHHLAILLLAGSTFAAKQTSRMFSVVLPLVNKAQIIQEFQDLVNRLSRPIQGVMITGQRLSSGFPDMALVLKSLKEKSLTTTLRLHGYTADVTIPTVLMYAQSLQLHLNADMQVYANQYHRHYWLGVVTMNSEVEECGDFLFVYYETARVDEYKMLFAADQFDVADRAAILQLFVGPYNYDQLAVYQQLMALYLGGTKSLNMGTVMGYFTNQDLAAAKALLTPVNTANFPVISRDERRDGKAVKYESSSADYRQNRITGGRTITRNGRDHGLLKSAVTAQNLIA